MFRRTDTSCELSKTGMVTYLGGLHNPILACQLGTTTSRVAVINSCSWGYISAPRCVRVDTAIRRRCFACVAMCGATTIVRYANKCSTRTARCSYIMHCHAASRSYAPNESMLVVHSTVGDKHKESTAPEADTAAKKHRKIL